MENLKNVAPIEDFNWDAYETNFLALSRKVCKFFKNSGM